MKNDIGESYELTKFTSLAMGVVRSFYTPQGFFHCPDHDSLVMASRIQAVILQAVVAERDACRQIVSKYVDAPVNIFPILEAIELEIEARNITEAQ